MLFLIDKCLALYCPCNAAVMSRFISISATTARLIETSVGPKTHKTQDNTQQAHNDEKRRMIVDATS